MAESPPIFSQASWADLEGLQGRWQHSLDDMGLFCVFCDVALFDRGTALRIKSDELGQLYAWGWVLSRELSSDGHIVWRRPGDKDTDLIASAHSGPRFSDHSHWKEWHTKMGTCAWRRVPSSQVNLVDRFVKLPPGSLPGLPERVSMFAVPPPADMPPSTRPWRFLVYGGCLTIGWPSGDVYARTLVDRLGELGVFCEVIGCGVSAHTSDQLAMGVWRKDLYDKMGLRGEGLLRLLKKQGPFDLVLIMVGAADIVRGKTSNSIVEMHRACHRQGARTVAIAVPPSWHDNPEDMHEADVQRARRLDENFGFCGSQVVARSKAALNQGLRELASEAGRSEHGHCSLYVDLSEVIPCNRHHRHLWEAADFIHLSACGYQTLGNGVAEQLLPLMQSMADAEAAQGKQLSLTGQVWRVRGGLRKGGLIVRHSAATDSLFVSGRLARGARLEQLELVEDRLHYRKLSGEGPQTGWVTVCTRAGAVLVERCGPDLVGGEQELEPDVEPGILDEHVDGEEEEEQREEPAEPEAAPEPKVEEPAEPEAAPEPKTVVAARIWRVVGGQSGKGIVVRHGKACNSPAHAVRLLNGSVLEEIEKADGRLRYRMRCGHGPHSGWVSVSLKGRVLVERDVELEEGEHEHHSSRPVSVRSWRCIFSPRVFIRQKPSRSAPSVGCVDCGTVVAAYDEPVDGWIRLRSGQGYVLTKHEQLGDLLVRMEASAG